MGVLFIEYRDELWTSSFLKQDLIKKEENRKAEVQGQVYYDFDLRGRAALEDETGEGYGEALEDRPA
ncbi:hypothetical protein HAX54_023733, partial [Datura stramonium]|nr:hypothetical protein [Datura stramonium]